MIEVLILVVSFSAIEVVDGDTVRYEGERLRIENIDAPETHDLDCEAEAELGHQATEHLAEIVSEGVEIIWMGRDDPHGRPLVRLETDGRDVGEMLVEEGYAVRWSGRRADWCG